MIQENSELDIVYGSCEEILKTIIIYELKLSITTNKDEKINLQFLCNDATLC